MAELLSLNDNGSEVCVCGVGGGRGSVSLGKVSGSLKSSVWPPRKRLCRGNGHHGNVASVESHTRRHGPTCVTQRRRLPDRCRSPPGSRDVWLRCNLLVGESFVKLAESMKQRLPVIYSFQKKVNLRVFFLERKKTGILSHMRHD